MAIYCTAHGGQVLLNTEPPANPDTIFWTLADPGMGGLEDVLGEVDLRQPANKIKRDVRDRLRPLWEAHRSRDVEDEIFSNFSAALDYAASAIAMERAEGLQVFCLGKFDAGQCTMPGTLILIGSEAAYPYQKTAASQNWRKGGERNRYAHVRDLEDAAVGFPGLSLVVAVDANPYETDRCCTVFDDLPVIFAEGKKAA